MRFLCRQAVLIVLALVVLVHANDNLDIQTTNQTINLRDLKVIDIEGGFTTDPSEAIPAPTEQQRLDTILRAFSRLPATELARYGLSEDLSNSNAAASQDAEQAHVLAETDLAQRIFAAWTLRQQELQDIMKTQLKPMEYMTTLMQQLTQNGETADKLPLTDENKVSVLEELEGLVTDIDNARDFQKIDRAWSTLLEHTGPAYPLAVRAAALHCVGSLVKGQSALQRLLLLPLRSRKEGEGETDGLALLTQTLTEAAQRSLSSQEPDELALLHKALYALSAALRGDLRTQQRALSTQLPLTLHVLMTSDTATLPLDLHRRVWVLVFDLVRERFEEFSGSAETMLSDVWLRSERERDAFARVLRETMSDALSSFVRDVVVVGEARRVLTQRERVAHTQLVRALLSLSLVLSERERGAVWVDRERVSALRETWERDARTEERERLEDLLRAVDALLAV